jgi:hypothetical protein
MKFKALVFWGLLIFPAIGQAGDTAVSHSESAAASGPVMGDVTPTDLVPKTLPEIYNLPQEALEKKVMERLGKVCEGLHSSTTEANDPAKLTKAQRCAVQYYTLAGNYVNKALWKSTADGKPLNGDDWAYVRVLDQALGKMASSPLKTVYRGASQSEFNYTRKGDTVRLKGYASTSPNRETAEGFIKDRLYIMKIRSGKNIKGYSNAGMEDEFLLPRSTFVVLGDREFRELEIFTENGPEKRRVEIIHVEEKLR